jgi:hypothetical protein
LARIPGTAAFPWCVEGWVDRGMGLRVGFININDMYNSLLFLKEQIKDIIIITMSVRGEYMPMKLMK